jgi:hypothetical protein
VVLIFVSKVGVRFFTGERVLNDANPIYHTCLDVVDGAGLKRAVGLLALVTVFVTDLSSPVRPLIF